MAAEQTNPTLGRHLSVRLSDPTPEQYWMWQEMEFSGRDTIRAMAWQYEIGEETERPHIQAYIVLEKRLRLHAFKDYMGIPLAGQSSHIAPAIDREALLAYCQKDQTRASTAPDGSDATGPFVWGDFETHQGKSQAGVQVTAAIRAGKSVHELLHATEQYDAYMVDHYRGLEWFETQVRREPPKEVTPKKLIIYWGDSGAGKSTEVRKQEPKVDFCKWEKKGGFLQGYKGAPAVCFDEYSEYNHIPWEELMQMAADSNVPVNVKNGETWWQPERIYLTSNSTWRDWYPQRQAYLRPLERRITQIVRFRGEYPNVTYETEFGPEFRQAGLPQASPEYSGPSQTGSRQTRPQSPIEINSDIEEGLYK